MTPNTGDMRAPASRDAMVLAACVFLVHLAGNPHYGFFRDELYFVVCGRRPALGYVDQPPLVPLLAALSQLFGNSLILLRAIPAALAAVTAYLVVLLTREMGGGRFAGLLAAICASLAPGLLAFATLLVPDATQTPLWTMAMLFTARALKPSPGWWLAVGASFGLAAEGKYSALIVAAALALALVLTDRGPFLSRRFWQGVAIGAALIVPNVWWQWQHAWPMLEVLRNGQHGKNVALTPTGFMLQQMLLTHPLLCPVWIAGVVWCLAQRAWRWLGAMFGVLMALMIALHGKSYYPVPIYPSLFAAGSVAVERLLARARLARAAVVSVCLAVGLALAPLAMPILTEDQLVTYLGWLGRLGLGASATENHKSAVLGQTFADMHGWQALANEVQRLRAGLPAPLREKARVFAADYGEAAAIDTLSTDPNTPLTLSGHNQYWLWGPGDFDGTALIDVGGNLSNDRKLCTTATVLDHFHAPYIMPYEDRDIILCVGLRSNIESLWPHLKHFD